MAGRISVFAVYMKEEKSKPKEGNEFFHVSETRGHRSLVFKGWVNGPDYLIFI